MTAGSVGTPNPTRFAVELRVAAGLSRARAVDTRTAEMDASVAGDLLRRCAGLRMRRQAFHAAVGMLGAVVVRVLAVRPQVRLGMKGGGHESSD
jgi:hypothetical protein